MDADQTKLDLLKKTVEQTYGHPIGAPTDFDDLAARIRHATDRSLGISTLKRLWGYVKSSHSPSYTTLSILARYAGFHDWHSFCAHFQKTEESGFSKDGIIIAADLEPDTVIRAEWIGHKMCCLKKIGEPARFEVIESHNIKLAPGDTLTVTTLSVGQKLIATDCLRDCRSLGTYIGATKEGLLSLRLLFL